MTTTDTDALAEKIAEELHYSQHPEGRHRIEWPDAVCLDTVYEYCDLAAAVLPIVAVEVRKAKAEAWDECAEMAAHHGAFDGGRARWLSSINPYIESGDSDERR